MLAILELHYLIIDISISDTYRKANVRTTNRIYPMYSRAFLIVGLIVIPLEIDFILVICVMDYGRELDPSRLILIESVAVIINVKRYFLWREDKGDYCNLGGIVLRLDYYLGFLQRVSD